MFEKRLLIAATSAVVIGLSTYSWGQNYQQPNYGGFDLSKQAVSPPVFADRQDNGYASMSPDSWGQPSAGAMQVQSSISNTPTPVLAPSQTKPAVLGSGRYPLGELQAQLVPESPPIRVAQLPTEPEQALPALTNTTGHRQINSSPFRTGTAQKPNFSSARFSTPSKQDFSSLAENATSGGFDGSKLPEVAFPFTRRSDSSAFENTEFETANGDGNLIAPHNTLAPSAPITTPRHTTLGHAETGMYPQTQYTEAPMMSGPTMPESYGSATVAEPAPQVTQQWVHPNHQPVADQSLPVDQLSQGAIDWSSINTSGEFQQTDRPNFRPDLGFRDSQPLNRTPHLYDDGKKFDYETKKKYYPPFKEIIATGRFFYNADVAAVRPYFLGNTGISVDGPNFSESFAFDFDTNVPPSFKAGFESQYGPGIELSYFNMIGDAEVLTGINDGVSSVSSTVSLASPGRTSSISADNVGESLVANHSISLEVYGINFFKELKFPISRLNGKFGFSVANLTQTFLVDLIDASGTQTGELRNRFDYNGYGPQFALEYFRPVGHTPLTLVTSFGAKGLFGTRTQRVTNSNDVSSLRFGADEFLTVIDFTGGLQYRKLLAENRYLTVRMGYLHQSWLGGGTGVDPQGDFGFNGWTFGVGLNR